jgi:hypothetical protein
MFEVTCGVTKRFATKIEKNKFVRQLDTLLGAGTHLITVNELEPLFTQAGVLVSERKVEILDNIGE